MHIDEIDESFIREMKSYEDFFSRCSILWCRMNKNKRDSIISRITNNLNDCQSKCQSDCVICQDNVSDTLFQCDTCKSKYHIECFNKLLINGYIQCSVCRTVFNH